MEEHIRPRLSHSNSFGNDAEKDTAGCRALDRKYIVIGGKKKNSADPFVIALAKQQNCKVVTEEVPTHNMNSPKIPDVCAAYNIECIDFIAFAREEKFAF